MTDDRRDAKVMWEPRRALSALLVVLILSACGGTTAKSPAAAHSSAVPASSLPASTVNSVFLGLVRKHVPQLAAGTDAQLLRIGHLVCGMLTPGDVSSWVSTVQATTQDGMPAHQAGEFHRVRRGVVLPGQDVCTAQDVTRARGLHQPARAR
ncbi:MAG: hypothetical protein QOI06_239 [Nocardioidaceae bacterium]|nr:hypothetical protein [Nocardioidaceae bacterium]